MRIKKMYQGEIPENKIVGTYTESNTDTYTCNYVNQINTYSTEEVDTGMKWLDGKKIYRKVYDIGNLPNASTIAIATGYVANNYFIINLKGFAYSSSYGVFPIPRASVSNVASNIDLYCASNGTIYLATGNDRSSMKGYVIVEYTKN